MRGYLNLALIPIFMIGLVIIHLTDQYLHEELNERIRIISEKYLEEGHKAYQLLNVSHADKFYGYRLKFGEKVECKNDCIKGVESVLKKSYKTKILEELYR